jgi:hypothetical protein
MGKGDDDNFVKEPNCHPEQSVGSLRKSACLMTLQGFLRQSTHKPRGRLDFSTPAVSIGPARWQESRVTFDPLKAKRFAMSNFKAQKADHGP